MPLPKTTSVGKVIDFLNKEKPSMPHKQMVAIALSQTGKSKPKKHKDTIQMALDKLRSMK